MKISIDAVSSRTLFRLRMTLCALLLTSVCGTALVAQDETGADGESKSRKLPWMNKLGPGLKRARDTGRSVLLRFDDENCAYCRALDEQIETEVVQKELKNWLLIKVDIDDATAAARRMRVTGVPALRVLSPIGRVVAQQDGALVAEDLVEWLASSRATGVMDVDDGLLEATQPDVLTVASVSVYLGDRDVSLREAAIRRLVPWPNVAAKPIVESLADGALATRLSAMELLSSWKAPLGGIDPWQPESVNAEAMKSLYEWADKQKAAKTKTENPSGPIPLTDAELDNLRGLIDRMLDATDDEASALTERIARGGEQLLPSVYERLKTIESDLARQRLTALRYRLVANPRTALSWSSGLSRLASTDLTTRKLAADELAKMATGDDERLLLELFSDPAPIVREISLRALNSIGSSGSSGALVKLLADPEPNIRAAVLGLLAESPTKSLVGPIVEYVEKETDADLIVHAVRFLREVKGKRATECLIGLLEHENWRIRSESAEAIGKIVGGDRRYGQRSQASPELKAAAWAGLVERLEDPDAFVVSRSATALASADIPIVIDPLAAVVERHPDLAGSILETMTSLEMGGKLARTKIDGHIIRFSKDSKPTIRAAAIAALATRMKKQARPDIERAFEDADEGVRIAAANGVFTILSSDVDFDSGPKGSSMFEAGGLEVEGFDEPGLLDAAADLVKGMLGKGEATIEEAGELPDIGGTTGDLTVEDYERLMREAEAQAKADLEEAEPDTTSKDAEPEDIKAQGKPNEGPIPLPPGFDPASDSSSATESFDGEVELSQPGMSGIAVDSGLPDLEPNQLGIAREKQLVEIVTGKLLDDWYRKRTDKLKAMAKSESVAERVAAARVLTAFGHYDIGLPILNAAIEEDATLIEGVQEVLGWLPWEKRSTFFDRLLEKADDVESISALAYKMAEIRDERAADQLWALLERDDANADLYQSVSYAIPRMLANTYELNADRLSKSQKKRIKADVEKRLVGGLLSKRLAFQLLLSLDKDKTYELSTSTLKSADDPEVRRLALAYVLQSAPKSDVNQHAIDALASDSVPVQRLALRYLSVGKDGLPGELRPDSGYDSFSYGSSTGGKPIIPELPGGVDLETVRRFENSDDDELRALGAYGLIMLAESNDVGPILRFRTKKPGTAWDKLAYRAIAFIDDPEHIPLLVEIYEQGKENYAFNLSDFYWTIRIMSGPKILALRKQMRDEMGMDRINGSGGW